MHLGLIAHRHLPLHALEHNLIAHERPVSAQSKIRDLCPTIVSRNADRSITAPE